MSTMPPRLLAALSALALALLTGLVVSSATAVPAAADPPAPPAATDATPAPPAANKLLLVFDSSGSMRAPDANGSTKIDAAKDAFAGLVPQLPEGGQVGLRVYGATVFDKDAPGACTDSQLAVPIGPADKPALTRAVAGFRPYGETPLSYSLQQGAKDLGTTGKRTILLVSDGEETCDPDPCATAREIAGLGIDLKIDVVGFQIEDDARDQLRCIADAGSGTFYETDDADNLAASLHRLSVRAFRPFRVSGRPVEGTNVTQVAPILGAGQYVDAAPRRSETKFYRLRRSHKGSTLHVGVSARPAPGPAVSSIHLETKTLDGAACGYGLGTEVSYARTNPVVTASASSWDQFTSYEKECQNSDEILLTLSQSDSSGQTLDGVPVELVVIEEPAVDPEDDLPPQADSRPRWTDPPPRPATDVTAGASFSDAPLVGDGRYKSSLFPGEVQFLRVRLAWGQRLQAAVRAPRPTRGLAALTDNPQVLDIAMISPTRGKARATLSNVAGQNQTFVDDDAAASARTTTVEVRYANRDAGSESQKSVAVPGDYYVAVALGEDRDDQTYLLPIEVVIAVEGTAGAGAPRYADDRAMLVPAADGRAAEFRPGTSAGGTNGDGDERREGGDSASGRVVSGDDRSRRTSLGSPLNPLNLLDRLEPLSRERAIAVVALSAVVLALLVASAARALLRRRTRHSRAGSP